MSRRRPQAAFLFGMFDLEQGLAIDHQYDRHPAVPQPGHPVVLRVRSDPGLREVTVVAAQGRGPRTAEDIETNGTVYPARPVAGHWEAVLPGMPPETIVHYVVRAIDGTGRLWYADGKRPGSAATVFSHRVTERRPPDWTRRAVIYQVFVDRFANASGPVEPPSSPRDRAGGDLHGVRTHLPYLRDLGVDTVWLTPIFPAKSYHGYDATDLFDVEHRFGGKAALASLVDAARDLGIRVVLDFVPNHVSDLHPWFRDAKRGGERRNWFFFRSDGAYDTFFGNPGMPKVNLANPEAQAAMIAAMQYWLDEFGVAGYRLDHVLGPAESFFAAMSAALNAAHPTAWLFGEATATPAYCRRYGGLLDGATDFNFAYALRDYFAGDLEPAGLVEVEQEAPAVLPHERFSWVRFVDNHDMSRALQHWGDELDRLDAALRALFSLPGVPAVLYGTEQGLTHEVSTGDGGLEVGRVPMRFDPGGPLVAELTTMIAERRSRPIDGTVPVYWDLGDDPAWDWGGRTGRLRQPPSAIS